MKTSFFVLIASSILLINLGCEPSSESSDDMTEAMASSEPGEPILLTDAPSYTEGPVIDKDGNIYISEPYRGPITKITPAGEVSTWSETEGGNGHIIRENGSHLVCDHVRKEVIMLDENGQETGVAASSCGEHALRGPNDLVLDSEGGFYFTDPMGGEDEPMGRVCYVDASGESHMVAEREEYLNGIGLSPDGSVLYVAGSLTNVLFSYSVESPGQVGPEEVFVNLPEREDGTDVGPDGITVDDNGNIYVAHFRNNSVQVVNAQGELINTIAVVSKDAWISNVVLGGPNKSSMYVTGNPGPKVDTTGFLYKIEL